MIYIDTGAFIARYIERDRHHKKSLKIWEKIRSDSLYTSNYVLDELLTYIGRIAGNQFIAEKVRTIYASPKIKIMRTNIEIELASRALGGGCCETLHSSFQSQPSRVEGVLSARIVYDEVQPDRERTRIESPGLSQHSSSPAGGDIRSERLVDHGVGRRASTTSSSPSFDSGPPSNPPSIVISTKPAASRISRMSPG